MNLNESDRTPNSTRIWLPRLLLALTLSISFTPRTLHAADDSDTLPALIDLLKESDDPQFQLDILKGMSEALKGKANVAMPKGWKEAAAKLAKSSNAEVKSLTASLSTYFGDEASMEAARKLTLDKTAAPDIRQKALASMLDAKPANFAPFLQSLLPDPTLRPQALKALARYEDPQTPAVILDAFKSLTQPEKLDALNTLASREPYALELLKALKAGRLAKSDLTAATIRQLSDWKNDDIDKWIKDNWGAVRTSSDEKLTDMKRLREIILSA